MSPHAGSSQPKRLAAIFDLLGDAVLVLHAPDGANAGLSGTDIDCAVVGGSWLWPLRLPGSWKLCQRRPYDLGGCYWVLDGSGEVVMLDVLDDPLGLGRDGVATSDALVASASPSAIRAAYLTSKRVRKNMLTSNEWERIGALARQDEAAFRSMLRQVMGGWPAKRLEALALAGQPPSAGLRTMTRIAVQLHRVRSPRRVGGMLALGARRWLRRFRFPTGLSVLVAGPDGSGKSMLASRLPSLSEGLFRTSTHVHWRPGLLPSPGALLRRPGRSPSQPHGAEPHTRAASIMLLGYFWADSFVGGLRLSFARVRSGLVVTERGWWDMAVDQRRYRLDVPPALVTVLGRLLPRPDLTLVLEADANVLMERKAELSCQEIERQRTRWRHVLPDRFRRVYLDAAAPAEEVGRAARDAVITEMEARATARLDAGWVSLPSRASGRWVLPRGPRRVAATSLRLYHPMTTRGRAGWETAGVLARFGAFRLLKRGEAPPRQVRAVLAPHVPRDCTLAVAQTNHAGRYVAMIVDRRGGCRAVAKVATSAADQEALAHEARALRDLAPLLQAPLAAPTLRHEEPGLLLFEPVEWQPRRRPWILTEDVGYALGAFFVSRRGTSMARGPSHGDCAPWNLFECADTWLLLDWERALGDAPAFYDINHYLTQAHTLLGRPTESELLGGFTAGSGWVARAIDAYSAGAEHPACSPLAQFKAYLHCSQELYRDAPDALVGVAGRRRLLAMVARVCGE